MHFYQFHIGDYKSHTHHLSIIEDMAYRRLLDHYYLHEAPIKQRDIARQIGMRDHEQEVLTVLDEFFVSTDVGFINPRADAEIVKYRKFSDNGKKGAAKRWHKDSNGEANSPPNATPIATNNQEPITKNQKKTVATKVARPELVSSQVWEDWLSIRRAKKLPLTDTAWTQILAEIEKSGHTVDVVIKECCLRGWAAFKVAWLKENPISATPAQAFAGDI